MIAKISLAVIVAMASLSASAAAPVYKIELIPRTAGIMPLCGTSINDKGEVSGYTHRDANGKGYNFRYSNGVVTFLPDDQATNPRTINAAGDMMADGIGTWVWHADGSLEQVSDLEMFAMNDKGVYVGTDYNHGFPWERALMVKNGSVTDLGTLGGDTSAAMSVNNLGQVTGYAAMPGNAVVHAFIWKNGQMRDIGALFTDSWAQDINEKGHVVGHSDGQDEGEAFLYDGTTMKALPRLQGQYVSPLALNDKDEVVGNTVNDATLYRAGKTYKLRNLLDASGTGWKQLVSAYDINEKSQITGCGNYKGWTRAFVATPVTP